MRTLLTAVVLLLAVAARAQADDTTIYYYDPSASVQAPPAFEAKVNPLLEKLLPGAKLRAFVWFHELQAAINQKPPNLVLIPPYLRKDVGGGVAITPILIRERDHSWFYELVIVGPSGTGDLKGKTLAASGDVAQATFLDAILFKGTTTKAQDVRVLQVGKEIDGVLAAGTGQAAVACASPASVDLVKKANPAIAENLSILRKVKSVPLAAICTYGAQDEARMTEVKRVLGGLHKSEEGRKLLKLFKADKLAPVDAAIMEKIGQ